MPGLDVEKPSYMLDEELALFENTVARFLDRHAGPAQRRSWRENGCVDRDLWLAAGEAGLLGVSVPAEFGGHGGDFRHEAVLIHQLGIKHAGSFALPLHNAVVAPYLVSYASEAQRRRWLPSVVRGETVLAVAMTEPSAGSDLQAIRTTATRDGDRYRINGQKTFISNGLHADLVIVAAKTDASAGAKGVSLFLVEASSPGFRRGALLDKLGQEGRDTTELFFDDVIVPAENLLGGQEGTGFRMLMEKLPQERMVIALQSLAMIEAALETTIGYAKERTAFGRRLIEFQNTQFKLAECKTSATVARVFVDHCVGLLLQGRLDAATASMAKLWVSEAQGKIVDECLQLHGGYGYMTEYPIAEMYKDARVARIYGGTSEIMKLIIARSL